MSVAIVDLLIAQAAPLAGNWGELVSFVQLDVLHGVPQTHFVDARAPSHVSSHLDDWQLVNQFFCISHMSLGRNLNQVRIDQLVRI